MKSSHTYNTIDRPHPEIGAIEEVIRSHIGWALNNKDQDTLFSTIVESNELFYYQPDSKSTVAGIDAFRKLIEEFMGDDFKAIRAEIEELRIHMSPSLRTAWYSCILHDYNEFQGKPFIWEHVRWTGVLEKTDGRWRIFQMHFSKAEDLISSKRKDP